MTLSLLALALVTAQPVYWDASVGRPWVLPLEASGGEGTLSWTVAEGSLPPGVYLVDLSTVLFGAASQPGLYGVPSEAGQWSVKIQASDASGNVTDGWMTLTVSPLSLRQTQTVAAVGQAWSWQAEVAEGAAPFRYRVAEGGYLPLGLTMTEEGRLSGTAALPGRYLVPVEVRDAGENLLKTTLTVAIYGEDVDLPALGVKVEQGETAAALAVPEVPLGIVVLVRWGDGTEEEVVGQKAEHVYEKADARRVEVVVRRVETGLEAIGVYPYGEEPAVVSAVRVKRR